ncbi:hypothetical protein [Alienimonas sp. DA493]|uniref:hypothetical protein n=1 Tax=Alienimonas sp. DA493 TaxID=3373605 RepID=UPI00375471D2
MADDRIEFHCETCGKSLRAPLSKAGAEADCPQCGDRVRVPDRPPAEPRDDVAEAVVCPVCGERVSPDAAACPSCGELLGDLNDLSAGRRWAEGSEGPTEVTLGSVWHVAFEDWKEHFGVLLAAVLLSLSILMGVGFTLYVGMFVVMFAGMAAGGGGAGSEALLVVMAVAWFFVLFGTITAVSSWLTLGLAGMHLEAVRTRPELGTLFRSPGLWRMILCGLIVGVFNVVLSYLPSVALFGIGAAVGGGDAFAAAGLIGLYLVPFVVGLGTFLLFWPVPFLCLDRPDLGHVRPLAAAVRLPGGSWGGYLAVGAAAYGLLMVGYLLCGVGLLFTGPLAGLMLAHAYDRFDRADADAHGPRVLDPEGVI